MTLQDFAYLGNPITESSYGADIEKTVVDRNGATVATLKAEQYNGEAQVDYAAVLRSIQENDGVGTLASGCLYTDRDYALQVIASIAGTSYIFVRGVAQKANVIADAFKLLTRMPMLRHYVGYPLTVSYIINNTSATNWSVRLDGEEYENSTALANMRNVLKAHATSVLTNAPQGETVAPYIDINYSGTPTRYYFVGQSGVSGRPYLWRTISNVEWREMSSASKIPAVGDTIYTVGRPMQEWPFSVQAVADAVPYTFGSLSLYVANIPRDTIQVKEMPVPVHPFYVRWVNTLGGRDYFMFACNQKQMKSLSENDSYEKYIVWGRYGVRSNYNKAATHTIEVSTGVIDRATLESVAELIFSPLIQVYDPDAQSWIEIQVKDGKPELMADQPTGEMLITFELPTPQMNK